MDELLTVQEVADILKTSKHMVGNLLNAKMLPFLVLGRRKIRRAALDEFLIKYEGWDVTDPYNPKRMEEAVNA